MGGSWSSNLELLPSERDKCKVLASSIIYETPDAYVSSVISLDKDLRNLQTSHGQVMILPIPCAEVVWHVKAKLGQWPISEQTDVRPLLRRKRRTIVLTTGTVHLMMTECTRRLLSRNKLKMKWPLTSLLRVDLDESIDLVMLVAPLEPKLVLYQTPTPRTFLQELAVQLAHVYAGFPPWAVAVKLNVRGMQPVDFRNILSNQDGGFVSAFGARAIAIYVMAQEGRPRRKSVHHSRVSPKVLISEALHSQQDSSRKSLPRSLDVVLFVKAFVESQGFEWQYPVESKEKNSRVGDHPIELKRKLVLAALDSIPFNLVFRKLTMKHSFNNDFMFRDDLKTSLARVFLYNVTLREINLEGTNLRGLGSDLGRALAMNPQPLITILNLSQCSLDDSDWNGLIPGLARLWCGGSAVPVSLSVARNECIQAESWNLFWDLLIDPSKFTPWPSNPPPPPDLSFWQHLDVSRTTACFSPTFGRLFCSLMGLRSFSFSLPSKMDETHRNLLQAFVMATAKLESVYCDWDLSSHWDAIDSADQNVVVHLLSSALFRHSSTLKTVHLDHFVGEPSIFINQWPEKVPELTMKFTGNAVFKSTVPGSTSDPTSFAPLFSPGSISLHSKGKGRSAFVKGILSALRDANDGLMHLDVQGLPYPEIAATHRDLVKQLANHGLRSLNLSLPPTDEFCLLTGSVPGSECRKEFWTQLALSRTLEELMLPNQFRTCDPQASQEIDDEIFLVGDFLKINRSVRRIAFDSPHIVLDIESVKNLRAAFYGNTKVVDMQYPSDAMKTTLTYFRARTEELLHVVNQERMIIKSIFKRHYNKSRNWRDVPNILKIPHVNRIRMAKREIGRIKRDGAKIGSLLAEIQEALARNFRTYETAMEAKISNEISRRDRQLASLSIKKSTLISKLYLKLNSAKIRSRQKKSGKEQIPRSAYYRDKQLWPGFSDGRDSHYRRWNDPYSARADPFFIPPDFLPGTNDVREVHDNAGDENSMIPPPFFSIDKDSYPILRGELDISPPLPQSQHETEDILCSAAALESILPLDPWVNVDALIKGMECGNDVLLNDAFLNELHMEATELGPDVVSDISHILDSGSAVSANINRIAGLTGINESELNVLVDNNAREITDFNQIVQSLDNAPDFASEAEDAGTMYAGAGPRDLSDGGPSFGEDGNAAIAGARRRARSRQWTRTMKRVRDSRRKKTNKGYRYLSIARTGGNGTEATRFTAWPEDVALRWKQDVTLAQIEAISQSNVVDLPFVAESTSSCIMEWGCSSSTEQASPIYVALVTQCSVDRLPILKQQLVSWNGKASVSVYLNGSYRGIAGETLVMSCVQEAKAEVTESGRECVLEVAVTLIEAMGDDEPYPINFLRNSALQGAQYQFRVRGFEVRKTAVLLVDVDFCPSANLRDALHNEAAAYHIIEKRNVVICPAFETSKVTSLPRNIYELRNQINEGSAEGFHQSTFSQGHGPTDFDKFWRASNALDQKNPWTGLYRVKYENLFEPYIVMLTADVPLYDERFCGYGLNKISHLAAVAKAKSNLLYVLPGAFLAAPCHERSESWRNIYGLVSEESEFNLLLLKGLYCNFSQRLSMGLGPVVSTQTTLKHSLIWNEWVPPSAQQNDLINDDEEETKIDDPLESMIEPKTEVANFAISSTAVDMRAYE